MSRIYFVIILLLLITFLIMPGKVWGQTDSDCPRNVPPGTVCLKNPLAKAFFGQPILEPTQLVQKVILAFSSLMGAIAIAFTVFNGFKLVIATTEEGIKTARAGVTWSVGGFILSLLAFTIISGVGKFFEFSPVPAGSEALVNPIELPGGERPSGDFVTVMNFVMLNFLGLVGFVTTGMIIYYGYRYLTSAGNEEAVAAAKTGLRWAVIGLIIILLAYTIITSVRTYLFQPPT